MTDTNYKVYVVDKDYNPLMPTKRFGWVRRALKKGIARVIETVPFTIQLLYEPATHVTQPITLGIDPGRTNIGLTAITDDGTVVFSAKIETRNEEIPKEMQARRECRQASRRGERLARKRLAKTYGTLMKVSPLERSLPGYKDGVMVVKDIINTEAKFNNRSREKGWLTPSAIQLLRTHINAVNLVCSLVPVTDVVFEVNSFDFQLMENPDIKPYQYANGPLKGHRSLSDAVKHQQNGLCLLCGKNPIEHDHHIIPKSKGGSDTIDNIAGICNQCHDQLHKNENAVARLIQKKSGLSKRYGALSIINQIMPRLVDTLKTQFPDHFYVVTGYDTKLFRDRYNLEKDHYIDAYAIAGIIKDPDQFNVLYDFKPYYIKQFRCHDRAIIKAQTSRSYYYNGEKVALNRKDPYINIDPRDLKKKSDRLPSLQTWYNNMEKAHGSKTANRMLSNLKVTPSKRRKNDVKRILPGAIVIYNGVRYIKKGQISNGKYIKVFGNEKLNIPASKCKIYPKTGLVFMS